jgi:multidrug efflux system outer membrane protein
MIKYFAVTLAIFCLPACMMGPDFQSPEPEMPAEFYNTTSSSLDSSTLNSGSTIEELAWWDLFQDPQLQSLIDTALKNNLDVKSALVAVETARARFGIERSGLFPSVGLLLNSEREGLSLLEDGTDSIANDHQLHLEILWEVDLWGARRRANEAANAIYLSSNYAVVGTQLSLISAVADTYIGLLAAKGRLQIHQNTVAAREKALVIAEKRFHGGLTSKLEVQQSRVELAEARAGIVDIEQTAFELESRLAILLGEEPQSFILTRSLLEQEIPADLVVGMPVSILKNRPDIMQSEQALHEATARMGIAKAAYFPTLNITGELGFETKEFSDLLKTDGQKWLVGGELLTPLFNAGRIRAEDKIAQLALEQAGLDYQQTLLQSLSEVSIALNRYHLSQTRLSERKVLEEASRGYLILAIKRYRNGVLAYIDVLDAQRKLLDAELSVNQSKESQLKSVVELYRVLGGGWQPEKMSVTTQSDVEWR